MVAPHNSRLSTNLVVNHVAYLPRLLLLAPLSSDGQPAQPPHDTVPAHDNAVCRGVNVLTGRGNIW